MDTLAGTDDQKVPDYYVAIDVKDTNENEAVARKSAKPEIVEISLVLINTTKNEIEHNQFHAFVKPTIEPTLYEACLSAIGIKQYVIDQAESWPKVVERKAEWLSKAFQIDENGMKTAAVVADGSYLHEKLLASQKNISDTKPPKWVREWINIRKDFRMAYARTEPIEELTTHRMLEILNIPHEGKPGHSRDDCFNLALLVVKMLRDGKTFSSYENMRDFSIVT